MSSCATSFTTLEAMISTFWLIPSSNLFCARVLFLVPASGETNEAVEEEMGFNQLVHTELYFFFFFF